MVVLQCTVRPCSACHLPGEGDDGGGRRLAGSSGEFSKDTEELGETKEDIKKGGSDTTDLGVLF